MELTDFLRAGAISRNKVTENLRDWHEQKMGVASHVMGLLNRLYQNNQQIE